MTGADETSPAVRRGIGALDRFLAGRCIATATRSRRPLAVTVLGIDVVTWTPLRLGLLLAGGQRSHELAVEVGVVSINLLAEQDHALARRYGGVGVGAGWDELLGVAVRYRRSAPAVLEPIDAEVLCLLDGAEQRALAMLAPARDQLDAITGALVEHEALEGEALRDLHAEPALLADPAPRRARAGR